MSGSPTFDIDKKNRNGANLRLRHALRAGGVIKGPLSFFTVTPRNIQKVLITRLSTGNKLCNQRFEDQILRYYVNFGEKVR